jgi:hypothetical protein
VIKVGDRIIYSIDRSTSGSKGIVVDIVIQTPHPIFNAPSITMCQVKWDKGWRQNSSLNGITWEEESYLQLDLQANRNNKLESIGI